MFDFEFILCLSCIVVDDNTNKGRVDIENGLVRTLNPKSNIRNPTLKISPFFTVFHGGFAYFIIHTGATFAYL